MRRVPETVVSGDRHGVEVEAIRRDAIAGPAVTDRSVRARVLAGDSPRELTDFLERVRDASYRVTDDDIAALKTGGLSEDEIYELTVAAAVGTAYERLQTAMHVLRASK